MVSNIPSSLLLYRSSQTGQATGIPDLQRFFKEFTSKVYQPGYKNFATLVHAGNTDGWGKAVSTFCNPGEGVLTEEWTYPSAMAVCFFFSFRHCSSFLLPPSR